MAEILPTPAAGTWLRIDSVEIVETQPAAGTWLRILPNTDGSDLGVGTWLRIDAVDFRRPVDGWSDRKSVV